MKTEFTKSWIIEHAIPIVDDYNGNITLRALHYRLVALGMINDQNHYKRVISAMTDARWEGLVSFNAFLDRERETHGETEYEITDVNNEIDRAIINIQAWANSYYKNRWENQPYYLEIFIEKKALQGVFEEPCKRNRIALNPCKGYPSLTFLNDASERFKEAQNQEKKTIILYFGDYDPSGEDIPRSIVENLKRLGVEVELKRIALNVDQVKFYKLPPAPTKLTDTRSARWDGIGQVELDAIEPRELVKICQLAIDQYFDNDLFDELLDQEKSERQIYQSEVRSRFNELFNE